MADFGFSLRIGLLENVDIRFILEILQIHTVKLGVYEQWPFISKIDIANVMGAVLYISSPAVRRFVS